MLHRIKELAKVWPKIHNVLCIPHNEEEYNYMVEILNSLIDEIGDDESHPLSSLLETIGTLIEAYEAQNIPEPKGNQIDIFKILMKEHNLKQSDLPEIGSQGVISEIMLGKRKLNIRQIKKLSERFHISPAVFI